ncbi:MAG: YfhO family protein [Lachnospiraceae bacterium]|nr:YfhO family protein [Lachnospiraceae bacterium]
MAAECKKTNKYIVYILCFIIPLLIAFFAFFNVGIYPGSENLLLTYDLKTQLLPLYSYISNGGPGFDNLLYSMYGCLGSGFFGTLALYISPFDFLYLFVPVRYLPDAILFMVLFKIGLCGLFCSVFLTVNKKHDISGLLTVTLSCCYALMSYSFMYYISPMWYDGVMLLPLIALSAEKIIEGKKGASFIVLMALCIISNYYIAFMIVISMVMYVLFRLAEEGADKKTFLKRFLSFVLKGIISAGISMFVLIPVYLDFSRGKFSEMGFDTDGVMIRNSLFDVLKSFTAQNYPGFDLNASPNIFCGSLAVLLALVWFAYGKKNTRARIAGAIIVLIFFASFIFGPLDRLWHGFRDPVNFSVRYAFTFVFFMICFAVRGAEVLKNVKFKITLTLKRTVCIIACLFTFTELFINGSFILAKTGSDYAFGIRNEYDKYLDAAEALVPHNELSDVSGYGRLMTNYKYSSNDGALYGYDGLSRFSSSYNLRFSDFLRSLGIGSIYQNTTDFGLTPPAIGLFGGRYFISYWLDMEDYDLIKEYETFKLYENKYALPMAFEINGSGDRDTPEFTENPFGNMDIIYSDLFSGLCADTEVFKEQDKSIILNPEHVPYENVRSIRDYSFQALGSGHYYMFASYLVDDRPGANEFNTVRDSCIDDDSPSSFGNRKYSLCTDLGSFDIGSSHDLAVFSSNDDVGEVWLYYYDEDAYKNIAGAVNGFELTSIGRDGLGFKGTVSEDCDVFVSLPYENGYRVYVDGKRTEYGSYRGIFMTVPVSAGEHEIVIGYFPPGLAVGIMISLFLILICVFYLIKERYAGNK